MSEESKWREEVSQENESIIANMTPEERELERQAILERFGPEVGTILRKAKLNKEKTRGEQERVEFDGEIEQVPGSPGKGPFAIQAAGHS